MLPAHPEQKVRAMNTEVTYLHLHVSGSSPSLSSLGHLLSTYFGLGSDLSPGDTTQIIWGCETQEGTKEGVGWADPQGRSWPWASWGKGVSGRGHSIGKGPEVRTR